MRAGFYRTGACDAGSDCLPLAECTYGMQYQAARGCLSGDRSMSCGSSGGEPFVCCPRGKFESVQACGKSLVSGQFYKGLGTFPFVARIGFKSECVCVCLCADAIFILIVLSLCLRIDLKSSSVTYPCGGSILSKRIVLTAAHCALAKADGHRL